MKICGSCLCQATRYEINGPLLSLGHCHCKMCQRFHGTAYATYGKIEKANFSIIAGREKIRHIQSSEPVRRSFCGDCGTPLIYENDSLPHNLWLAAGTFDEDPGCRPQYHIFVASKAEWLEINDGLPQFSQFPPTS